MASERLATQRAQYKEALRRALDNKTAAIYELDPGEKPITIRQRFLTASQELSIEMGRPIALIISFRGNKVIAREDTRLRHKAEPMTERILSEIQDRLSQGRMPSEKELLEIAETVAVQQLQKTLA